jgi:hypothetical protein
MALLPGKRLRMALLPKFAFADRERLSKRPVGFRDLL